MAGLSFIEEADQEEVQLQFPKKINYKTNQNFFDDIKQ